MYSKRSMRKFKPGAICGKQGKFRLVRRVDIKFFHRRETKQQQR